MKEDLRNHWLDIKVPNRSMDSFKRFWNIRNYKNSNCSSECKKLTISTPSFKTWSNSDMAERKMMEVTFEKQLIHFFLWFRWPPTSIILKRISSCWNSYSLIPKVGTRDITISCSVGKYFWFWILGMLFRKLGIFDIVNNSFLVIADQILTNRRCRKDETLLSSQSNVGSLHPSRQFQQLSKFSDQSILFSNYWALIFWWGQLPPNMEQKPSLY